MPVVFTGKHQAAYVHGAFADAAVDRHWELAARERDQLFILGNGWIYLPSAFISLVSQTTLSADSLPLVLDPPKTFRLVVEV
jgi:hypothetical protein